MFRSSYRLVDPDTSMSTKASCLAKRKPEMLLGDHSSRVKRALVESSATTDERSNWGITFQINSSDFCNLLKILGYVSKLYIGNVRLSISRERGISVCGTEIKNSVKMECWWFSSILVTSQGSKETENDCQILLNLQKLYTNFSLMAKHLNQSRLSIMLSSERMRISVLNELTGRSSSLNMTRASIASHEAGQVAFCNGYDISSRFSYSCLQNMPGNDPTDDRPQKQGVTILNNLEFTTSDDRSIEFDEKYIKGKQLNFNHQGSPDGISPSPEQSSDTSNDSPMPNPSEYAIVVQITSSDALTIFDGLNKIHCRFVQISYLHASNELVFQSVQNSPSESLQTRFKLADATACHRNDAIGIFDVKDMLKTTQNRISNIFRFYLHSSKPLLFEYVQIATEINRNLDEIKTGSREIPVIRSCLHIWVRNYNQ